MKRIILLIILTFCFSSVFAGFFEVGSTFSFEPVDHNIFGGTDSLSTDDLHFGLAGRYEFTRQVVSFDIILKTYKTANSVVEMILGAERKYNLGKGWNLEAGCGVSLCLERPVEGSNKIYLTTNGVNVANLFKITREHLVPIVGMIRPRFSVTKQFGNILKAKLDYEMNLYPIVKLFPEGTVSEFFGMGKITLGLFYII